LLFSEIAELQFFTAAGEDHSMKRNIIVLCLILSMVATMAFAQAYGVRKKALKPYEFGTVFIESPPDDPTPTLPPAMFPHWSHRMKYSCRLCHVDIGFGMKTGETEITKVDLIEGYYCGVCHDGTRAFKACEDGEKAVSAEACNKCHFSGKKTKLRRVFKDSIKGLPRSGFGNRVDWMAAEEQGLISIIDFIEGVSIKNKDIKKPVEFSVKSQEVEMPDIIFSHDKHTAWNGCEVCHPEIFAPKKGDTIYLMQSNFDGLFCGACHGSVAFPTYNCRQCHTKDVS